MTLPPGFSFTQAWDEAFARELSAHGVLLDDPDREAAAIGRPKSKYGRRDVPLPFELVCDLRRHRQETEWPRERDPVFASMRGTPLEGGNVRRRVLAPVAEGGRRRLGWLPHLPAHVRLAVIRERPQREAGAALARPPQGVVHARHLHPPALGRA
jgi:hypothetical protein